MAAEQLAAWLRPDMLLADRGFYSFKLWRLAATTGPALLWRVNTSLKLPVHGVLADGSYLSVIHDSADRARYHGTPVRVIEYALQNSATPTEESDRLITTISKKQEAAFAGMTK
jgi:hypothetical protein